MARDGELTESAVDGTNRSRGDEFPDLDAQWEESRPHSLHEEEILLLRSLHELLGLAGRHCERLLAKHVLAGLEREHDILEVVAVRGGNVDDLDIRVVDELCVAAVELRVSWAFDLLDEVTGAISRG